MRIVTAVHEPPVWTLPVEQVQRIARACPEDEVIDARTPDERARAFPDAEVLLSWRLTRDEARTARQLKWIQSTAVGVAELLVPDIVHSTVVVTNVRGVHSEPIAEHAIALVLALRRQLHVAAARQATRTWAQVELQAARMPVLAETRLVVIGLGAIGARVARMGAALGMRVTGVRRRPAEPAPPGVESVVGVDGLHAALADADAVVLAAPWTGEARPIIGADELAIMRPAAVLVNVARGRLIDDDALVAALETGRIAGAGLDAFTREPLAQDHPYWRLPNVIVTPHTASFGGDYWQAAVDLFLENLTRYRRGENLLNVVDKTRGY